MNNFDVAFTDIDGEEYGIYTFFQNEVEEVLAEVVHKVILRSNVFVANAKVVKKRGRKRKF